MPRSCYGTRHSQTHWFKSSGLFHRVFCDWSSVVIPTKLTPSLLISRLLLDPLGQLCSMCLSSSRIQLAIGGVSFQSGNGDRRSSSTPHVGSGSASHLLSSWMSPSLFLGILHFLCHWLPPTTEFACRLSPFCQELKHHTNPHHLLACCVHVCLHVLSC